MLTCDREISDHYDTYIVIQAKDSDRVIPTTPLRVIALDVSGSNCVGVNTYALIRDHHDHFMNDIEYNSPTTDELLRRSTEEPVTVVTDDVAPG